MTKLGTSVPTARHGQHSQNRSKARTRKTAWCEARGKMNER